MSVHPSPQLEAAGEINSNQITPTPYATILNPKQPAQASTKTTLKPVEIVHGEPSITFSMEERHEFVIEEGLHQAVVLKLSYGAPDLKVIKSIMPKHLGTKGNCLIGLLAPRQILLRFDHYEDFVMALSRPVNYFQHNGEKHQYRVFPWSVGYSTKEETTMAVVWISLPNLSPDLFAKKSLLSIASAIGKPIAIDKATLTKSRPSTARVKVILDVMDKLPNRIRLQFVDGKTGKVIDFFQEIVYDNLPLYCKYCKHQGHDETNCRLLLKRNQNSKQHDSDSEMTLKVIDNIEKYQGDARNILNEKRKVAGVNVPAVTGEHGYIAASNEIGQQLPISRGPVEVLPTDSAKQKESEQRRVQEVGQTDANATASGTGQVLVTAAEVNGKNKGVSTEMEMAPVTGNQVSDGNEQIAAYADSASTNVLTLTNSTAGEENTTKEGVVHTESVQNANDDGWTVVTKKELRKDAKYFYKESGDYCR